MKNKQKKFILYLQVDNGTGSIKYTVDPLPATEKYIKTDHILEFYIDISKSTTIKLYVDKKSGNDSYIQVKSMSLNNIDFADLNSVSFVKTVNGEIRRTHGYIDTEGEFVIKLHTNPISQNYLNYLLSLTK